MQWIPLKIFLLGLLIYKYRSWWHMFETVHIWNSTSLTCGRKTWAIIWRQFPQFDKWNCNTLIKPLKRLSCVLTNKWRSEVFYIMSLHGLHTVPFILFSWFEHCPSQTPLSGFLASQITTSQWMKTYKTWTVILIHIYSFLIVILAIWIIFFFPIWNYLATQVILVFSKGKHLDFKALEVRGILDSGIYPNRMGDHLVHVHWVNTAGTKKNTPVSII